MRKIIIKLMLMMQRPCNDLVELFKWRKKAFNAATHLDILCKFVNLPLLRDLEMPKAQTTFVEAICNTINEIKIPKSGQELFLKRFITTMLMNVESSST